LSARRAPPARRRHGERRELGHVGERRRRRRRGDLPRLVEGHLVVLGGRGLPVLALHRRGGGGVGEGEVLALGLRRLLVGRARGRLALVGERDVLVGPERLLLRGRRPV